MPNLLHRLEGGEVLIADGAMGTMLFEAGLRPGDCPEELNLTRPELLREVADAYLNAGADIVQTNTFGGSPLKLAHYKLDDRTEEINSAAVKAVRDVVGGEALISGSVGPSGAILKPYGETDPEDVSASFRRQIKALAEAGVDHLCVETMTDLTEAQLAIRAAREMASDLPICATMTFDDTPNGFFTIMGVSIQQAADGLIDAGADIIGSNCGNGIDAMVRIAKQFRACTDRPLIIQSNAGLPIRDSDNIIYPESPEYMADRIGPLIDAGVQVIGGCCGTTPEHIRAFKLIVGG